MFPVGWRQDISLFIGHQTMGNTNLPDRTVHHPEVLDFELNEITGEDSGLFPLEKTVCSYREGAHIDGIKSKNVD